MQYIKKTKALSFELTGTFYHDEKTGEKYPQYASTGEDRHVIKIRGSNIVLSDDEIEKLIPFLRKVKEGEEKPTDGNI